MKINQKTIIIAAIAVVGLGILATIAGIAIFVAVKLHSDKGPDMYDAYANRAYYGGGQRVYSKGCDGFANIRSTPGGSIIGKLKNGPDGAEKLGEEGSWTRINYHGVIGYVYSNVLQTTPTAYVDINLDLNWLTGTWENGGHCLYLYDNGQWACGYGETTDYGTYIPEGHSIKFTTLYTEPGASPRGTFFLDVSIYGNALGSYRKHDFSSSEGSKYTKDYYKKVKKNTASKLKHRI